MAAAMNDQPGLIEVRERLDPDARERAVSGRADAARAQVPIELVLDFDARQRSRLRAVSTCGRVVGLFLERGGVLRDGDWLCAIDGTWIRVRAAPEIVSEVICASPRDLARAAYHLGNRHVALQVGEGWLRYRHDHVLDGMIEKLGFTVTVRQAPFEPEAGAYQEGHSPVQDHQHAHGHEHDD